MLIGLLLLGALTVFVSVKGLYLNSELKSVYRQLEECCEAKGVVEIVCHEERKWRRSAERELEDLKSKLRKLAGPECVSSFTSS